MPRKLNTEQAREMAAKRKHPGAGTGRPKKKTPCPRCGTMCPGYRLAQVHCSA